MRHEKPCCFPGRKRACCLRCHFNWEQEVIFPKLPSHVREQLMNEHALLLEPGTTQSMIESHNLRELVWFRAYCTPSEIDHCEKDHAKLKGKTS